MDRRVFLKQTAVAAVGAAALGGSAPQARAGPSAVSPARGRVVRTGVEMLAADGYRLVQGQKVGVITNPTGVLPDLRHEVDVMHASRDVELVVVFGPEHGFRGSAQAGGSEGSYRDPRTGLPVYDTYGKGPRELAETFGKSGVDTVLFDIQDVGARFYTYIWTMYDAMAGAALAGKRFVVLDRPNPLGVEEAAGPVLHEEYATFVGRKPISQAHAMTVAELARLFNGEFLPIEDGGRVDLAAVRMTGWRRRMPYTETGLPWVLPSPNMPTVDTATVYPGTCMFEGTNLSEGRGTALPFELIGAPYVDHRWSDALNRAGLPGAWFREAYFQPTFSKWQGEACGGVQLHVTDRERFDAVGTGIAMLASVARLHPDKFSWRRDEGEEHPYWIDKLTGSDRVRTAIDAGKDADEVIAGWQDELRRFRAVRERYLLYH
ncbi:MAG: DUF1343 domain-containing protein [Streptosporangiales bacterium]|nr:DUF1343 domain-containing protein [Streptosporangiales bacterium]